MKKGLLLLLVVLCTVTSCHRNSREMWEDSKTCGRYFSKGLAAFFGQHADPGEYSYFSNWSEDQNFIPLAGQEESYAALEMSEYVPLAMESPGDPGSTIPGISGFHDPTGRLAQLFSNIHFDTDNYAVKGEENVRALYEVAKYMIKNPTTYIFVEGHADERGAAAYNLALGSRRANSIRTFLIQNGVNPDQLFTISYGKERPCTDGHGEMAWHENRRGQFKLYQR